MLIMMPGTLALVDFFERLADNERIQSERVFVNAAVFERESGWFSVRDHDDLAHVFFLAEQDALRQAKPFARVGVIRADLDARELAQGNFFRAVVEKNKAQRVSWILRANEMRECHSHALCGREAVLAVQNHAVAAIEKNDRGAGAVIFALMDHEIGIRHVDGNFGSLAAHGVEKRLADVEIHGVAELVGARHSAGFDAGREIARVVTAETAAAQRAQEILKRFEAEEVDGLVGDFEAGFGLLFVRLAELPACGSLRWRSNLRRLLRIDEAFLREPFH